MTFQKHPFHLVDASGMPLFASIGAFSSTMGGVAFFHGYSDGGYALAIGQLILLYSMFLWWRDVIREATFEGHHTVQVQAGLQMGMNYSLFPKLCFSLVFFGHSSTVV